MERTSANSLTIGIQRYICHWKQESHFVNTLWISYRTQSSIKISLGNLGTSLKKLFEKDSFAWKIRHESKFWSVSILILKFEKNWKIIIIFKKSRITLSYLIEKI